ncbi:helix-turn-helix transcriptional regulator [Pasteurella multocida]|uniref:helix-turn-helix domain-containing protein n=1 Tax=Pasteurella multocida TaxID=747 RepID=UPI002CADE2BF|nr:helix-turn-helix transcriptional regulator [Pasteurella multocida]MEB3466850.1 helix-turn-helix transcriptional regulator [Pasteurella multocida]
MSFGERLKEERERIGLSQVKLGVIGGVTKLSQLKYENNINLPKADYLIEIAKVGIDVNYVLFGTRKNSTLTDEEELLLTTFRSAPPVMRQFMLGEGVAKSTMKIKGDANKQKNHTGEQCSMEIEGNNNIQIANKK